ncbi:MAG: hypothetical protein U1F83_17140 [Verrucomicrobiota bacterium]
MTLLTGLQDVGLRKVGSGIGGRQDVVVTVAVEAGGDGGCDHRFAKRHGLAVIGVAIMLETILVAFAAARVAGHFQRLFLAVLDARGVAISADGAALVAFGQNLAVNTFLVGLFNPDVALAAGLGDVGVIDGRITIHAALDVVDAVAVVAGGRNDETHLEQRAAVDAVLVAAPPPPDSSAIQQVQLSPALV